MDTVGEKIRSLQKPLIDFLNELASQYRQYPEDGLQHMVITDRDHGHFQLTRTGWQDRRYYFMVLIHADIRDDGKIWILQNNTEVLIDEQLAKKGVSKSDIVLGFRPAHLRSSTTHPVN